MKNIVLKGWSSERPVCLQIYQQIIIELESLEPKWGRNKYKEVVSLGTWLERQEVPINWPCFCTYWLLCLPPFTSTTIVYFNCSFRITMETNFCTFCEEFHRESCLGWKYLSPLHWLLFRMKKNEERCE